MYREEPLKIQKYLSDPVRVNLSLNFARYPSCGNFTFQAQFENSLFVKCAGLLESHLCTKNNQVYFLYPGTFMVSNYSRKKSVIPSKFFLELVHV